MVLLLKRVQAPSRQEIVQLVEEHYRVLEDQLELIGKDLGTREETLWDLTAVDRDRRLVLIAIELRVTDALLFHLVRRLDWVWEHMGTVIKMYPSYEIRGDQLPRIMVGAPSFPLSFRRSTSYFTYRVEITLFTYTFLECVAGKGIFLETLENRVKGERPLKGWNRDTTLLELSSPTKVTSEEIMEFLT